MNTQADTLVIETNAPIPTWFHIGGRADRLARPQTHEDLLRCLEMDPDLVVLGEGANLLVDDAGIDRLVVSLQTPGFRAAEFDPSGLVRAGAGVALPRLISDCVKRGLSGIETLAGIPATVGGATIMNAGGAFGEWAQCVRTVFATDRAGREHAFRRDLIDFGYRRSHLNHLIVTGVELALTPREAGECKAELTRCMAYKTDTQPLKDKSAGCVFKNPVLHATIEDVGEENQRVSAGMLIDRAGCKGLRVGGASVSTVHANFFVVEPDASAADVIALIAQVRERVMDAYGVVLDREIVVWERTA
ncbi:MAG: UDP-N-acetylmuramate dehydrogenase [Phycisphaerales bacterium]|nr:UDP-N-acetylmuramate dehydrogenase [Planctomycetota bacterium]MCH8508442.1 UDP-N-acetylmuramate dehydrogenase [Phycisphaerales bacterium]